MNDFFHLIDGVQAIANPVFKKWLRVWIEQGAAIDLYKGLPEALHLHGPVLCQLDSAQTQDLHQAMGQEPNLWAHMVSALTPAPGYTLQSCAEHFEKHALTIETSDKQRYHLRFADTRIFAVLPSVMNTAQWHVFSQCWHRWTHMNRHNQLEVLQSDTVKPIEHSNGLLWGEAQWALLMDLSWPDTLLNEVNKLKPQWQKHSTRAQRHTIAKQVQSKAQAAGKSEDVPWQIQACLSHTKEQA